MSGILVLLRTDGEPVDPGLALRMTEAMALRGPDRQRVWSDGPVAFGHALLRTTRESEAEEQPFSLDGQVWIVADGRVDARQDLIAALGSSGDPRFDLAPDVELMLRAYLRWGDHAVEHLLGDFAFAIWDGPKRRLFCARDHMGVKPFYYSHVGPWLLVSSTIESLRLHPGVSDRLNDLAIADFLLFGTNQDMGTTSFEDIRRLPPAHTLTWSDTGLAERRYWTLPIEDPLHYRRSRDYIDQYRDLVRQAVSDRLRTSRVGVFMSGGLDSTGLAAAALELLKNGSPEHAVRAFTFVFDSFFPDAERRYAGSAAQHLGIPIDYYVADENAAWRPSAWRGSSEPLDVLTDFCPALTCYADMAAHSRVAFYGEGPDNALTYEWQAYLAYLRRTGQWGRLVTDACRHLASHKRVPLLPTIPRMLRDRRKARNEFRTSFPGWIPSDLVDRLQLRERWRQWNAVRTSDHPVRPRGYASLLLPEWQRVFERVEPACTGVAMEVRHPYLDLRVLRFLLRVPALPWCRGKWLQRQALYGMVPEAVRRRPKAPLSGNSNYEMASRYGLPAANSTPLVARYGDPRKLSDAGSQGIPALEADLRLVALSYWLPSAGSSA